METIKIEGKNEVIFEDSTYVPPTPPVVSEEMVEKGSSQTATEAPKLAAKREARTPPLPAPIVKRSKS